MPINVPEQSVRAPEDSCEAAWHTTTPRGYCLTLFWVALQGKLTNI